MTRDEIRDMAEKTTRDICLLAYGDNWKEVEQKIESALIRVHDEAIEKAAKLTKRTGELILVNQIRPLQSFRTMSESIRTLKLSPKEGDVQ